MNETQKTELAGGGPVTPDHRELKPNGQQKGYVVLSPEERAKGFVRPYRDKYAHVGRKVCGVIRLDDGDTRLGGPRWVCTLLPEHDGPHDLWTEVSQPDGERARSQHRLGGCGTETRMARDIAETYAREPSFYSGTFCVCCGTHLPLNEFVWSNSDEQVGS